MKSQYSVLRSNELKNTSITSRSLVRSAITFIFLMLVLSCPLALSAQTVLNSEGLGNLQSDTKVQLRAPRKVEGLPSSGGTVADPVVAEVGASTIQLSEIDRFIGKEAYALEERLYTLRKGALESLITTKVLEEEARRRGISVEDLTASLIPEKVTIPSQQVEQAFAEAQDSRGNMPDGELRERLRLELEAREKLRHYREGIAQLQAGIGVHVLLSEPPPQTVMVDAQGPAVGPSVAAVTIVEFSDFQCPYCKRAESLLKQLREQYGSNLRLIYRHMPLEDIHPFAFKAARASVCADAQGKFWEYHDLLFESATLTDDLFLQLARQLVVDPNEFRKCLESQSSELVVRRDMQEAGKVPVTGTPTFLVNGRVIAGARSIDTFKKVIDEELSKAAGNKERDVARRSSAMH